MDDVLDDDLVLSRHAVSKSCLSFLTVTSNSFISATVDDDDDSRDGLLIDSAFLAVGSRADGTMEGEKAVVVTAK